MTIATGTATQPELKTLHDACVNLVKMLQPIQQGDYPGTATSSGRFTAAQIDTQITAVSAAITAVNA